VAVAAFRGSAGVRYGYLLAKNYRAEDGVALKCFRGRDAVTESRLSCSNPPARGRGKLPDDSDPQGRTSASPKDPGSIAHVSLRARGQPPSRVDGVLFTQRTRSLDCSCYKPSLTCSGGLHPDGACRRGHGSGSAAASAAPRFVECICWRLAKRLLMRVFFACRGIQNFAAGGMCQSGDMIISRVATVGSNTTVTRC
jgi:hypothetical protein